MPHILIIDDDPDLLSVCRVGLAAFGHELHTAETGSDGLTEVAIRPESSVRWPSGMPR